MRADFVTPNIENGRYARQIGVPGFGMEGQERVRSTHVLVSRCGGVGGAVATHLARAGIGELTIAHGGKIEAEALNRMPLAFAADVGRPAAEVHAETINRINPDVKVNVVHSNVNEDNAAELVRGVDLVVDGAPLFEERYLMNREAVRYGKTMVTGAMYDTDGYVTTIVPGETACFSCVNPVRPDYWDHIYVFPAMSPTPSMVGAMMGMEVLKVLTGMGEPLLNKLWFCDMRTNNTNVISIQRRSDCEVCGSN